MVHESNRLTLSSVSYYVFYVYMKNHFILCHTTSYVTFCVIVCTIFVRWSQVVLYHRIYTFVRYPMILFHVTLYRIILYCEPLEVFNWNNLGTKFRQFNGVVLLLHCQEQQQTSPVYPNYVVMQVWYIDNNYRLCLQSKTEWNSIEQLTLSLQAYFSTGMQVQPYFSPPVALGGHAPPSYMWAPPMQV